MSDLIDRKQAIDAIVNTVTKIGLHDNSEVARYGATFRQHEIIDIIECVPSVQPETHDKRTETHACDCISRQQAIDWCLEGLNNMPSEQPEQRPLTEDDYAYCEECDHVEMCRWYPMYGCEFKSRPSAQPETCEDAVSRQAAIDAFHTWFSDGFDEDRWWNSTHVLAAIEGLPSAQPEIVRCKECMNHGKEICYFWSHFYGTINTPDDGFCHKAERRTDE